MKNDDPVLHKPSEALRGGNLHYSGAKNNIPEIPRSDKAKHDTGNGNEGSTNEVRQKEKLIDPGNEHTHRKDAEESIDKESAKRDADSGSDGTGSTGPQPE